MNLIPIDSLDDPRLAPYRQLKDRELARDGDRFIAQGEPIVRRLLNSTFTTESVLLADDKVDAMADVLPDDIAVYRVTSKQMNDVLGFKFYSSVMAVGVRLASPTLESLFAKYKAARTVLVVPEVINHENLGVMIRTAAAFGLDAVLLGERCHDPFWRRSIRVSMGATFHVPIRHSPDLATDMRTMRDRWGFHFVGAVLADDATLLPRATRDANMGVVMGHEWSGIAEPWLSLCDRRVTLPMASGTDSLNVAMATAVFLYHFTQVGK